MAKQTKLQMIVAQLEAKGVKVVSFSARTHLADAFIDLGHEIHISLTRTHKMSVVQTFKNGKMAFGFENAATVEAIMPSVNAAAARAAAAA